MNLDGRVALVTGAALRIGRALAVALAARGVRVVVHHHTSAAAAGQVVAEIRAAGGEAVAAQADLRDLEALPRLMDAGVAAFGAVDVLINSASIFQRGTLLETTAESWENHFAVNLRAPFFLAQAYARRLAPEQRGHIINLPTGARAAGSHYMPIS